MVLHRPWCAGEITTAKENLIPIVPVFLNDYLPPNTKQLALLDELWTEQQKTHLLQYGITMAKIVDAYHHFLALEGTALNRFSPLDEQCQAIVAVAQRCGCKLTIKTTIA